MGLWWVVDGFVVLGFVVNFDKFVILVVVIDDGFGDAC